MNITSAIAPKTLLNVSTQTKLDIVRIGSETLTYQDCTPSSWRCLLDLEPGKVLIVDDRPFSRMTAVDLLAVEGHEVLEADSSSLALDEVAATNPDLILLDVMMGNLRGFETCKLLKQDLRTAHILVIFITVMDDRDFLDKCFEVGDDLLIKPFDRMELRARVKSSIERKRLMMGFGQIEQVLFSVATALENRYSYNPNSSTKVVDLAKAFGEHLQLSALEIDNLICAAYLHDIGKVGIPDSILLKQGELTAPEREILKQHVLIGEEICQPLRNRRGVLPIIRHHHERWDGSGYPDGLAGNEIPWLAQVFQILDIYNALKSKRPHKEPKSSSEALEIIIAETKKGWRNPEIVKYFIPFIKSRSNEV